MSSLLLNKFLGAYAWKSTVDPYVQRLRLVYPPDIFAFLHIHFIMLANVFLPSEVPLTL